MLNKMMMVGGQSNKNDSDMYGGVDFGGEGMYNAPSNSGSPYGSFDPGGEGMYQGSLGAEDQNGLFGLQEGGSYPGFNLPTGGSPTGGFDLNSLMGGNTGTLIQAFLDDQNRSTAQNQINDMTRAGIPYDQSNREAASRRLTGLTDGTINASTDPAFLANLGLRDANLSRQFNARGMSLSGNEIGALSQQDLAAYSDWRQRELEREMTRSGATFNPSSTANAGINAAAFMAAMRGNNLSSLMAGLNRGPSTVINNNPNGNSNDRNGNRDNTNRNSTNRNNNTDNFGNQIDPRTGLPRSYGFNDSNYNSAIGSNVDDAPDYGNNSGINYNGGPDYGDPFGGGDYSNLGGFNDYGAGDLNLDDYDFSGMWDW